MEPMFTFDSETTGLERGSRAVEIAGVMFDDTGVLDRFECLINPGMPIPPDVTKINGITDAMVKDAPGTHEALCMFFAWIGECRSGAAHYALYDTGIISWDAARVGLAIPPHLKVIDTCELAKDLGVTKNNKLDTLVAHYGITRTGAAHRAMSDADACYQVFAHQTFKSPRGLPPASYYRTWARAGHDYEFPAELPSHLDHLPMLVEHGDALSFVYEDDGGARTERTVTPYGWHQRGTEVYFHGLCHLRQARRMFRADRVLEVLPQAA